MGSITDLVSFYAEKVTITIDGEKLEPGQIVIARGRDRKLGVDGIGGIRLAEDPASAAA